MVFLTGSHDQHSCENQMTCLVCMLPWLIWNALSHRAGQWLHQSIHKPVWHAQGVFLPIRGHYGQR